MPLAPKLGDGVNLGVGEAYLFLVSDVFARCQLHRARHRIAGVGATIR